ncbi:polysaccharide pyruvyl transferase CsaB [Clostridium sp. Cult2]|uniref:polysaccharide pyruvyl transferase CsaB n=1 Tax=Clostridium sp. Cult2 TaxID=2079003 RepID=UPI001F030E5B|nr:polysaccharide pyruvyl transferase CsaB [Clostridium sp. Cult2]MCF6465473.1 polysaccharide pyruvyl transferase CsaB [Clostridium sp. Cult2]
MASKKRILISGYYGFDNSGDDAILKAIVKDIKENNNSIEITVLSNNPTFTEKVYNIKAVNRFKIKKVIKSIKECHLFISGGGSLLQDITSTRSLLYYLTLMKLAKKFGKPIMVYANGIGPIDRKLNRFLTRKTLNKVDLITLRDEDSKIFLENLGVENSNIFVTADPVFTLEPSEDKIIDEILNKENVPWDKPLVGVSVRNWINEENLIPNVAKAIDYVIENYKVNVVLIPMHYPEDLSISNRILERVTSQNCYIISNKYNVEDIMGIIKRLEIIVAMRLHSLIYAATQNVPMVGIVYDPKIEGFLKSINMGNMCPVEDVKDTRLIANIDYVWQYRQDLKKELKELDIKMREEALKNVHMALGLLEE